MLSNKMLLKIFRYYVDASPQFWPRLVHICRRWRHIVFMSYRDLHLRLFCMNRMPVLNTIDCWPALPIVVEYGGSPALDPPAPEDEDNIMAALKHCGHVSSISLTVTMSLLERFYAIKGPFSELEHLVLLSEHGVRLTLPSTFQWGSRLRSLHLTGIAPLELPQLLSSSSFLVDIQLHEIPGIGCFTPKSLHNALSGMTQLKSLSLQLLPNTAFIVVPQPPGHRAVPPTLTCLKYQGASECFNDFLSVIHTPRLADIEITFFDEPIFALSNLPES
jgi:hypothetical protein